MIRRSMQALRIRMTSNDFSGVRPLDMFIVSDPWWHIVPTAIRIVLSSARKRRFCISNHNAPVYADENGVLWVLEIAWPRTEAVQIQEWLEHKRGIGCKVVAVRPKMVIQAQDYIGQEIVDGWSGKAASFWSKQRGRKYPLRDLYIILKNTSLGWLKKLKWIKPDKAHLYCTEGVIAGYVSAGMELPYLTHVDMPTPWHVEEACRLDELRFVGGDYGIWARIISQEDASGRVPAGGGIC